jgi:hypothetical protein
LNKYHATVPLKKDENNLNSWIYAKGEGRLTEPSSELKEMVAKCDILFDAYHGNSLRVGKNPLAKLNSMILTEYPSFPPKIVELFCRVKFFSRIKDMNIQLKLSRGKSSVRSLKQTGQFIN